MGLWPATTTLITDPYLLLLDFDRRSFFPESTHLDHTPQAHLWNAILALMSPYTYRAKYGHSGFHNAD